MSAADVTSAFSISFAKIDAADYRAQLAQTEANLAAAEASLTNLANQKEVQRTLIRQAQATIQATTADLQRYALEATRNVICSGLGLTAPPSSSSKPRTTKNTRLHSCS
jgi:hypothetical protein